MIFSEEIESSPFVYLFKSGSLAHTHTVMT